MTKKKWNKFDQETKDFIIKISKERNCSLDEAWYYIIAVGGAVNLLAMLLKQCRLGGVCHLGGGGAADLFAT